MTTVVFQGRRVSTGETTVAAFLAANGVDAASALVEYGGEVYAPGTLPVSLELSDGAELNVFRVVAGG